MCMIDMLDGGSPTFHQEFVARREHLCGDCRRRIAPGERYTVAKGPYDGQWWRAKQCDHCRMATKWLIRQCNGFLYEGVLEDLEEHWNEDWLLRSHGLGRLILGMRKQWQPYGKLLPLQWVSDAVASAKRRDERIAA